MATTPMPVHGVDISHHQSGTLDMATAKARGLRWLYHKATEGNSFKDGNYTRRRAEAARVGLPFGAYHFARASRGDAVIEAKHFLATARPVPGDLRPALDLETDEGLTLTQIRLWAKEFIDTVEKAIGVKPIVYTPYDLGAAAEGCLLWRPRYNNSNTPPTLPWDIWQFSNGQLGVPNSLGGFGRVDLNTHRKGLTLTQLLIPKPVPETKLDLMHASMQYNDSPAEMESDLTKIFTRAQRRKVAWITGTEAGPGADPMRQLLMEIGPDYGYRVYKPSGSVDGWIAVDRDLVVKGSWQQGFIKVIPSSGELRDEMDIPKWKRWGAKGIVHVSFDTAELGHISVGTSHYLTDARHPGSPYWDLNKRLALHIGAWGKQVAKGSALAFYGGDQNMADSKNDEPQGDTFMGAPFTSLGDELGKYENTGHGPIDVMATYDGDGRVSALYWRALDDRELPLFTDHFLTEGGVLVRHLS